MEDLVELSCARIDSVLGRIQQLQQQAETDAAAKGPSFGLAEEVLELMTENATLRKTVNDYVWMVAKPVGSNGCYPEWLWLPCICKSARVASTDLREAGPIRRAVQDEL